MTESPTQPARVRFYFVMSLVMLGLVGLGFLKSFFLRPLFANRETPVYVLVHGGFMLAWFAWYVWHTGREARGRLGNPGGVGWWGIAAGAVTIVSGCVAGFGTVTRNRLAGRDIEAELAHFADVVWSNMSSIVLFACFYALALCFRGRPEARRRLLFLTTLSIMGPALGRVGVLPIIDVWPGMEFNTLVFYHGGRILLPLALVVHDLATTRRLHPATWLGIPGVYGGLWLVANLVPTTAIGQAAIRAL